MRYIWLHIALHHILYFFVLVACRTFAQNDASQDCLPQVNFSWNPFFFNFFCYAFSISFIVVIAYQNRITFCWWLYNKWVFLFNSENMETKIKIKLINCVAYFKKKRFFLLFYLLFSYTVFTSPANCVGVARSFSIEYFSFGGFKSAT